MKKWPLLPILALILVACPDDEGTPLSDGSEVEVGDLAGDGTPTIDLDTSVSDEPLLEDTAAADAQADVDTVEDVEGSEDIVDLNPEDAGEDAERDQTSDALSDDSDGLEDTGADDLDAPVDIAEEPDTSDTSADDMQTEPDVMLCTTACDCDLGLACIEGVCRSAAVPVYCCGSDMCPESARCQHESGRFDECPGADLCTTTLNCVELPPPIRCLGVWRCDPDDVITASHYGDDGCNYSCLSSLPACSIEAGCSGGDLCRPCPAENACDGNNRVCIDSEQARYCVDDEDVDHCGGFTVMLCGVTGGRWTCPDRQCIWICNE